MNRMTKEEVLTKLSNVIKGTSLSENDEFLLELMKEFGLEGLSARNFLKLCEVHKDENPHIYYVLSGDITRRQMGVFFPITTKGEIFLKKHRNS